MSYIVCGFFTPDYHPWAKRLSANLASLGIRHDLEGTLKRTGGWEANTMAKAGAVLRAMDRHPDKVIVWLDVDCEVKGDLAPLVDLNGDVAVYMHGRRRSNGGYKMHAITRTIVLKPNLGARTFVDEWVALSDDAEHGDVDQTTFLLAMSESTGTSFQPLEWKWSSTDTGIIVHDQASRDEVKITNLQRLYRQLWKGKAA